MDELKERGRFLNVAEGTENERVIWRMIVSQEGRKSIQVKEDELNE